MAEVKYTMAFLEPLDPDKLKECADRCKHPASEHRFEVFRHTQTGGVIPCITCDVRGCLCWRAVTAAGVHVVTLDAEAY